MAAVAAVMVATIVFGAIGNLLIVAAISNVAIIGYVVLLGLALFARREVAP